MLHGDFERWPEKPDWSAANFLPACKLSAAMTLPYSLPLCYSFPTFFFSTLPSVDTPYPMLILCGPPGSGKRYLARRLCQEFPDFFGFG